jgi:hypothetical protein
MPNPIDEELLKFASHWKLDGDYIRCARCNRPHLASYASHAFEHANGCHLASRSVAHPWVELARILERVPQDPDRLTILEKLELVRSARDGLAELLRAEKEFGAALAREVVELRRRLDAYGIELELDYAKGPTVATDVSKSHLSRHEED